MGTSNWKVIVPKEKENLITNTSFEIGVTDWATGGTNTILQNTPFSFHGTYNARVTYQDSPSLASYTITLPAAGTYVFSVYVFLRSGWLGGDISLEFNSFVGSTEQSSVVVSGTTIDKWARAHTITTVIGSDLTGLLVVTFDGAPIAGNRMRIDAAQCEVNELTSYINGDLPGDYTWTGTPNDSTSTRGKFEASGGEPKDLNSDLDFVLEFVDGSGMPPVINNNTPLPLQAGTLSQGQNINARQLNFKGSITGDTTEDFHTKKQAIVSALDSFPQKINKPIQPRTFQYVGAGVPKEITGIYDGGLEGGIPPGGFHSEPTIRVRSDSPYFHQIGETGIVLDSNDSATFERIAGREGGIWGDLGSPASSGIIQDMVVWEGNLYIVGSFVNWAGDAMSDFVSVFSLVTRAWASVGGGTYPGTGGSRIKVGPDSALYVGDLSGWFRWDGSFWTTPGSPSSAGSVKDFDWGSDGRGYLVGGFTNWDGNASSDGVVIYDFDAGTFSPLGTGANGNCQSVVALPNGVVYIGKDTGGMTTLDGVTVTGLAKYVIATTTVTQVDGGVNAAVNSMVADKSGIVYLGGVFTDAGYVRIAKIQNDIIIGLGDANALVNQLRLDRDQRLYVVGDFATIGDLEVLNKAVFFNGSVFANLDINLPGGSSIFSVLTHDDDLFLGTNTSGSGDFSGNETVTYVGTAPAYPTIRITRTGGTAAKLVMISNIITGAMLMFDYDLIDGEILVIDTRPTKQTITSSFRGNVFGELLPNSDFGKFYLMQGNSGSLDNVITTFIDKTGGTILVQMTWKDAYISED